MKTLSVSTAKREFSVALLDDEHTLYELRVSDGRQHTETLLLTIDRVFSMSDLSLEEIDLFACAAGPGLFTGLRVGLATMKGLAMVLGKPVVGVSSLEALAFSSGVLGLPVCALMHARLDYVYYGLFFFPPSKETINLDEESFCPLSHVLDRLPDEFIFFVGDGADFYREEINDKLKGRAIIGGPAEIRANAVGVLGLRSFRAGRGWDPRFLTPHYIQASSAETKVDKERLFGLRKD